MAMICMILMGLITFDLRALYKIDIWDPEMLTLIIFLGVMMHKVRIKYIEYIPGQDDIVNRLILNPYDLFALHTAVLVELERYLNFWLS